MDEHVLEEAQRKRHKKGDKKKQKQQKWLRTKIMRIKMKGMKTSTVYFIFF